jgi:hypothetical protein
MPILAELPSGLQLTDLQMTVLRSTGVRTADDLHGLLSAFPSLATQFGIASNRVTSAIAPRLSAAYAATISAAPPPPPAMGAIPPIGETYTLGTIAGIPPLPSLPVTNPSVTGVSSPIDLRLPNWPVRDQGQRGTCVAFGATACVEHWFSSSEPPNPDFSEQFLYYEIKTNSGDPSKTTDGTWLQFAEAMLHAYGICREATDPYVGPGPITPVSGAPPSAQAVAEASHFVVNPATYIRSPGAAAAKIVTLLQNGRPVAASFPVFTDPTTPTGPTNWTTPVAWSYGRVFDPPLQSVASAGHCVCITGFVPDATEPNGGYFTFRNSWSAVWSSASPSPANSHAPEVGYGELSATYVDNYCWELLQL